MRGRRSKAYKKLMTQYHHVFGFREPYQVLVDSQMIQEAARCTMDLAPALERTVRGTVKPMITQCSIRHLYLLDGTTHPNKSRLIDTAKKFERRKCGHHELDEPLPEKECFDSVVNIKGENKHRYCVAAQDHEIRKSMREIPGVPSIAINRSVMILEPMTDASVFRRDNMERKKFREGIMDARAAVHGVQEVKKRKRGPNDEADGDGEEGEGDGEKEKEKKKKKRKGPPGPNPLSVKKKKKPKAPQQGQKSSGEAPAAAAADGNNEATKKRRKRKHGKGADGEQQSAAGPTE